MSQVPTAETILLEDGQRLKPVASFLSKTTKSHIVAEEGFYALYMENPAGRSARTPWISKEAWMALNHLPSPDRAKLATSQLSMAAKDLQSVERGSKEWTELLEVVSRLLPKAVHEELSNVVVNGPIWAGDSISAKSKSTLHELGLATYVVEKGEDGFSAATYIGFAVYKLKTLETVSEAST